MEHQDEEAPFWRRPSPTTSTSTSSLAARPQTRPSPASSRATPRRRAASGTSLTHWDWCWQGSREMSYSPASWRLTQKTAFSLPFSSGPRGREGARRGAGAAAGRQRGWCFLHLLRGRVWGTGQRDCAHDRAARLSAQRMPTSTRWSSPRTTSSTRWARWWTPTASGCPRCPRRRCR